MRKINNKKMEQKKGVSPVIATVLLMAMTFVLASIIFLWARGFISEQVGKFGQPAERTCEQVDFYAELAGENLDIVNRGNVPIYNFEIKKITGGGDSYMEEFKFSINPGEAGSKKLTLDPLTEKIIIFPRILGTVVGKNKNKAFTCLQQGITINL